MNLQSITSRAAAHQVSASPGRLSICTFKHTAAPLPPHTHKTQHTKPNTQAETTHQVSKRARHARPLHHLLLCLDDLGENHRLGAARGAHAARDGDAEDEENDDGGDFEGCLLRQPRQAVVHVLCCERRGVSARRLAREKSSILRCPSLLLLQAGNLIF